MNDANLETLFDSQPEPVFHQAWKGLSVEQQNAYVIKLPLNALKTIPDQLTTEQILLCYQHNRSNVIRHAPHRLPAQQLADCIRSHGHAVVRFASHCLNERQFQLMAERRTGDVLNYASDRLDDEQLVLLANRTYYGLRDSIAAKPPGKLARRLFLLQDQLHPDLQATLQTALAGVI